MPAVVVLIFIPILFYLTIPAAGAFFVRKIWRRFRENMVASSFFPICGYDDIIALKREGYYRLFGEIEAVQSQRLLWVKNSEITMTVKMEYCNIYMIPSEKKMNSQMPIKLPWSRVFSIAEGTAIFVSGDVRLEDGRAVFSGRKKDPLTVIIYDGEQRSLLERSISCGRQKNEYWNFMTPWSIAVGGILSLILLDMMIKASVSSTILLLGIIVSSLPLIPFLPPGLVFFILYSNFWKKGRLCRADRDLISLPLRFEDRNIKDSDYYHMRFSSGQPLFPLTSGYRSRNIHFYKENRKSLWNNSAFGRVVVREDGKWLCEPEDPMKMYLVIYDHPRTLINQSTKKALVYELLSLLCIFSAAVVNTWVYESVIRAIM